jgi:FkbM family methyltransferase
VVNSQTEVDDGLIYDLGLHDGQDTDFYLKKGFRVVAVEANPALAESCAQRFATQIAAKQLTILNVAIAPDASDFEFHINHQNSKWSSLHLQWGARGARGYHTIKVPGRRLEDIVAEHGVPRYLKIDIEGADLLAVDAISRFPARPRFVSVEGGGENFLRKFAALGYDRFAVVNQAKVPEVPQPDIAREGVSVVHSFPMGASGPFGTEIVGPWMTLDETIAERRAFRALMAEIEEKFRGQPNRVEQERTKLGLGWYDVHAARAIDLCP